MRKEHTVSKRGDTATLLVESSDGAGTVTMIREGGKWKLQNEKWKMK